MPKRKIIKKSKISLLTYSAALLINQSPGGGEHVLSGVNDAREAYFYSQQNGDFKSYVEMTSSPNKGNGWYFGVSFDRKTSSILFENRTAAYDYMWEMSFSAGGNPIREVSGWDFLIL